MGRLGAVKRIDEYLNKIPWRNIFIPTIEVLSSTLKNLP
jgi:hypothetical protein